MLCVCEGTSVMVRIQRLLLVGLKQTCAGTENILHAFVKHKQHAVNVSTLSKCDCSTVYMQRDPPLIPFATPDRA